MTFLLTFIWMVAYVLVGLTFYFYFIRLVVEMGGKDSDGEPITRKTIVGSAVVWPITYIALVVLAIRGLALRGK